jgi:anti-anti-sigma factor
MEMVIEMLADGIKKANLTGRLDIPGAMKIDLPFNVLVGNNPRIIIDLEHVTFMASMGIRSLIMGAKTVKSKGGKIVLLKPSVDVHKVLTETGTDTIVPIVNDLDSAIAVVSG